MIVRGGVTVALLLLAGACSSGATDARTVRVFAAASLTNVFSDLAVEFELANPDIEVELVFAGSSSLVAQASEGAPFDVLATADEVTMQRAVDAGEARRVAAFATNAAVVVTQPALIDTPLDALTLALCAPEVPCGRAAVELLGQLGIEVEPVTLEANVSSVLTKLTLDEVDAGVIYKTDLARTEAELVPHRPSDSARVTNRYPVALATGETRVDASAFVDFLFTPAAQARLAEAGFDPA